MLAFLVKSYFSQSVSVSSAKRLFCQSFPVLQMLRRQEFERLIIRIINHECNILKNTRHILFIIFDDTCTSLMRVISIRIKRLMNEFCERKRQDTSLRICRQCRTWRMWNCILSSLFHNIIKGHYNFIITSTTCLIIK